MRSPALINLDQVGCILDPTFNPNAAIREHAADTFSAVWPRAQRPAACSAICWSYATALIVGAALLMRVPTNFTIIGYPAIAMMFFIVAAIGGLALVVAIMRD